jgi:hypothetical protein
LIVSTATLQLNIVPKRMLTKSEAAQHCGRSVRRFEIECPVAPIRFPNGDLLWDVKELDTWLDNLKAGTGDRDVAAILARLG